MSYNGGFIRPAAKGIPYVANGQLKTVCYTKRLNILSGRVNNPCNYFQRGIILFFVILIFAFEFELYAEEIKNMEPAWLIYSEENRISISDFNKMKEHETILQKKAPIKCSPYNFDLYFELFAEDRDFQFSSVNFPLKLSTISPFVPGDTPQEGGIIDENNETETKIEYLVLPSNYKSFFIFPNRARREQGKILFFMGWTDDEDPYRRRSISLCQDGSCLAMSFIFKWDGCWFLSEIKDSSL